MKNALLIFCALILTSCSTLTRGKQYPLVYEEKPASILIMPPINNTTFVDAKQYFYTSLSYPLSEKGYYVVSPYLAMDLLKSESAYDSEMFIEGNLKPFKEVFGADAALFTIIKSWKKMTIGNSIKVDIEYILKSTHTGNILFNRSGEITVDCSVSGSGSVLIDLAASMINTAITDKVIAARRCNIFVLEDLPAGKYSPLFGKDSSVEAGKKTLKGTVKK